MLKYFSSIVGGSASELPCTVHSGPGERVWSNWFHYTGVIKPRASDPNESDTPVSVFRFEAASPDAPSLSLARACVKRLRTVRHPHVLQYKDSVELSSSADSAHPGNTTSSHTKPVIYLVTEQVTPLSRKLRELQMEADSLEQIVSYGLKQVSNAVGFLNANNDLVHGLLGVDAIMVTERLDWKVAAFDALGECDGLPSRLDTLAVPHERLPPEVKASSADGSHLNADAVDAYGLSLLIVDVCKASNCSLPEPLKRIYSSLCARQPSRRTKPLDLPSSQSLSNRASDSLEFLSQMHLKDAAEKEAFFRRLPSLMERITPIIVRNKLLPEVAEALQLGSAPGQAISGILQAGQMLNEEDFRSLLLPIILKLFGNTDRIVRSRLLEHIEEFEPYFSTKDVDDTVYPSISGGFVDTSAQMRELTLKSMSILAGKMSQKLLVSDLLKRLSRLQMDEEAAIRANTTIALGNMASHMPITTGKRVLVNAFTRALKDSATSARTASLKALTATHRYIEVPDIAQRVLPTLAPLTIDQDTDVRENALHALDTFRSILRNYSEDMKQRFDSNSSGTIGAAGATNESSYLSSSAGASSLLSWASSFTQRLSQASSVAQVSSGSQQQEPWLQHERSASASTAAASPAGSSKAPNTLLPSDAWSPSAQAQAHQQSPGRTDKQQEVEQQRLGSTNSSSSAPVSLSNGSIGGSVKQKSSASTMDDDFPDDSDEGWEGFDDVVEQEEAMRQRLASSKLANQSQQPGSPAQNAPGRTHRGEPAKGDQQLEQRAKSRSNLQAAGSTRRKLGATKLNNDWQAFLNDDIDNSAS